MLYAAIPVGALVVFITETLSAFYALTPPALFACWSVISVAGLFAFVKWRARVTHKPRWPERWDKPWLLFAMISAALVIAVGCSAIVAAPNTWDSMQYHLPRVVEWATYRTVAFYPTRDYQQLFAPPFSEYAMLQTFLLTGGDRAVSLVQWLCWIGCIAGSTWITSLLGGNWRAQALAGVVTLALPSGMLSASGPKNDCVVAFWIIVTICLLLEYRAHRSPWTALALGGSLGLACLTKGTAYLYLPCFFAAVLFLRSFDRRGFLRHGFLIGAIAVSLNAPQALRNYQLSGSFVGFGSPDDDGHHTWANARISVGSTVENIIRNLLCHVATRSPAVNREIERSSRAVLRAVHLDANDPATTWQDDLFRIFPPARHEIFKGNPAQLGLFLLACCVMAIRPRRFSKDIWVYTLALIGSFVIFCAALRYQSWNARLHLPLFVAASPVIASVASEYLPVWSQNALAALLLLLATPNAFLNVLRPLLSRPDLPSIFATTRANVYFYDQHIGSADSYQAAVDAVKRRGCHSVGIDASAEHFEYPLFALLRAGTGGEHVVYDGVTNLSRKYRPETVPELCAVVCPSCAGATQKESHYEKEGFAKQTFGNVDVFVRDVLTGAR